MISFIPHDFIYSLYTSEEYTMMSIRIPVYVFYIDICTAIIPLYIQMYSLKIYNFFHFFMVILSLKPYMWIPNIQSIIFTFIEDYHFLPTFICAYYIWILNIQHNIFLCVYLFISLISLIIQHTIFLCVYLFISLISFIPLIH